jgi:hypothetical protein
MRAMGFDGIRYIGSALGKGLHAQLLALKGGIPIREVEETSLDAQTGLRC